MSRGRTILIMGVIVIIGITAIVLVFYFGGKQPNSEDIITFFTNDSAMVQYNRDVTSRQAGWDMLRNGSPAAEIDSQTSLDLVNNFILQAKLISADLDAEKAMSVDLGVNDEAKALLSSFNKLVIARQNVYSSAEKALDLWLVVSKKTNLNDAQKAVLEVCRQSLADGKWTLAYDQCKTVNAVATATPTSTSEITPAATPTNSP